MKKELFFVMLIAGAVSYFDQFFEGWGIKFPIIPMNIPAILGMMITLVLAFRINQSYDRWWEARKIWGMIVNDSRALIREVSHLRTKDGGDEDKRLAFKDNMTSFVIVWSACLAKSLRGQEMDSIMKKYLSEERIKMIKKIDPKNIPNALLYVMMEKIHDAYSDGLLNDYQQIRLTETLNGLSDSMGMCERIKGTVFPRLYSKLIDGTTWVFVFLLPLAFRDPNEYVEFPVVVSISMAFFTLENIAKGLQDPFDNKPTDIPISSISGKIEQFGLRAMGRGNIPKDVEEKSFYLM